MALSTTYIMNEEIFSPIPHMTQHQEHTCVSIGDFYPQADTLR